MARVERMKTLLQDMLDYVSVQICRQLAILEYFSDEVERAFGPCGLCDRYVAAGPVRRLLPAMRLRARRPFCCSLLRGEIRGH
ncbi:MAG: RecQ family zinc-binding domain-containing protein [Nitrospira sp.]|nr:RecQ family zinc-binding domain-containing protein [Nitrospira sp.]